MKKITSLLSLTFISFILFRSLTVTAQTGGQHELLTRYYALKNALVSSNATLAATEAAGFSKALDNMDMQKQPSAIQDKMKTLAGQLRKESALIAGSKDLSVQREKFAGLSEAMIGFAKLVKLSSGPVYVDYCPMKKSSWLSAEKPIRNPYYGNSMLTCGRITDTLQ